MTEPICECGHPASHHFGILSNGDGFCGDEDCSCIRSELGVWEINYVCLQMRVEQLERALKPFANRCDEILKNDIHAGASIIKIGYLIHATRALHDKSYVYPNLGENKDE